MKKDLVMGWVFIAIALLMVFCIVVNCINGNLAGLQICGFALVLNVCNAITHFHDYKRRQQDWKDCMARFNDAFKDCWPDEENDEPEADNRITD